jgi:dTDP-4-amino-4,6-dideoxygalactose transaminase
MKRSSGVNTPLASAGCTSANASRACGYDSNFRFTELQSALGYPALSGSCSEIYLERCFQEAGLAPAERLPVARELGETSLMFLVHPTITHKQMAGYAEAVRTVVARACR